MKFLQSHNGFLLLIAVSLSISLACISSGMNPPTETPMPTTIPISTNTPVPTKTTRPTFTPRPTNTPRPTPAPMGVPVMYGGLEITLLDVTTHDLIVPSMYGGYWYSKPGEIFVDMGVLVRNLTPGDPVTLTWDYVYMLDVNGDSWYPNFGDILVVSDGTKYDPFKLDIGAEIDGGDYLEFDYDTYMRLIFYTIDDRKTDVFFGIGDSPLIVFRIPR